MPFSTQNPNQERTVPNTIILRGMDEVEYDDLPAAEEIMLGSLVERVDEQFQLQATDGVRVSPYIAVANRGLGHLPDDQQFPTEFNNQVRHDRYFAGDTVFVGKLDKGHQALVRLSDGNTVVDGDPLLPDGTGGFRAVDTAGGEAPDNSVFMAVEDVDNSGESDGADYLRAEVTL